MRRAIWWGLSLWVAVIAVPSLAADMIPLPMASKWQLDYSPTTCRLLAAFGADGDTVEIAQSDARAPLTLTMVSKAWPATSVARSVAVWTSDPKDFLNLLSEPLPMRGAMRFLRMPLAIGLREKLNQDSEVGQSVILSATTTGRKRSFAIGKPAPLLRALDRCVDDLMRTWGFDPVEQRNATAPAPIGPASAWLKPDDFPVALLRENATGGVNLRLNVDTAGRVTGCDILDSGGAAEFQSLSCKLLKERGHYTPATSKSGIAISSYIIFRVIWQIPSSDKPVDY